MDAIALTFHQRMLALLDDGAVGEDAFLDAFEEGSRTMRLRYGSVQATAGITLGAENT